MTQLDKLNLDRMRKDIDRNIEEKELRGRLNDMYDDMLDESPSLRYILSVWINDNKDKIIELDIQIDYLSKELINLQIMVDIK